MMKENVCAATPSASSITTNNNAGNLTITGTSMGAPSLPPPQSPHNLLSHHNPQSVHGLNFSSSGGKGRSSPKLPAHGHPGNLSINPNHVPNSHLGLAGLRLTSHGITGQHALPTGRGNSHMHHHGSSAIKGANSAKVSSLLKGVSMSIQVIHKIEKFS